MKQIWPEDELITHFTITSQELYKLANKSAPNKIGFAVLLKFYRSEYRFPSRKNEIPKVVVSYLAEQLELEPTEFENYRLNSRTSSRQRSVIRKLVGFRQWKRSDAEELTLWLINEVIPKQFTTEKLTKEALKYLQKCKIEPPGQVTLKRIVNSAMQRWEDELFLNISSSLSLHDIQDMDKILQPRDQKPQEEELEKEDDLEYSSFRMLKSELTKVNAKSMALEVSKLQIIEKCNIPTACCVSRPKPNSFHSKCHIKI